MKKIMIVAAAALWGTVAFSVESGNIVGYSPVNDNGNYNPGVGSIFMPVGGGETYKLSTIVPSVADNYMDPEAEYLQRLNPNGSAVVARYTYISKEWLEDAFGDDWEDFAGAIGWWNWTAEIVDNVENANYTDKLDGEKDPSIPVGTAFLGSLVGNGINFTSSGEVPLTTTAFNDNGNYNPFFLNYLPVAVDLTAITVSVDGNYMDPEAEYLQVLNPNGSAVVARYTYISRAWLEDAFGDDWADFAGAIGWWNWTAEIVDAVENADYTNKISAEDVVLEPGDSFLGSLVGNGLDFNFPAAF